MSCRRRLLALLVAVTLVLPSLAQQPQPDAQTESRYSIQRAVPLNRFAASRHSLTGRREFYSMPTGLGDDYFDGTSDLGRVERHLKIARELGARYLRFGISWHAVEKSPRRYDWCFWDELVELANYYGIQLLPYVAYTPEWAASEQDHFWSRPPRDVHWFGEFMFQVVSRYRGDIHSWEIWNEPDLPEYWRGTAGQFADLVIEGTKQIRRADPKAVVVLGGFSGGPDKLFTTVLEQYHLDRYVDVVALHGYPESWHEPRTEDFYGQNITRMSQLAGPSGVDVWLNEFGYADYRFDQRHASSWGTNIYYDYEHTPQYAATELFKDHVIALASGMVSLTSWYRIDDFPDTEDRFLGDGVNRHLGLVDAHGRPKPAYFAFKFFNQTFNEPARLLSHVTFPVHSQAVLDIFEKKDGELVLVGWLRSSHWNEVQKHTGNEHDRRKETVSVDLPCGRGSQVQFYDPKGERVANAAQFADGTLSNVVLTGEHLFIAAVRCVKDKNLAAASN